jgi:hypothetical protein
MNSAWYNIETDAILGFKIWNSASFTNPEAKAALLTLECTSEESTIHIYTDSLTTHNILRLISSNNYADLTIRQIIKRNCWMTWERLYTMTRKKKIILHSHKILAHSGNLYNYTANLAAKTAVSEISDMKTHNSEECRFFFTLKHRNCVVEKNPRRYLKHFTQNIRYNK